MVIENGDENANSEEFQNSIYLVDEVNYEKIIKEVYEKLSSQKKRISTTNKVIFLSCSLEKSSSRHDEFINSLLWKEEADGDGRVWLSKKELITEARRPDWQEAFKNSVYVFLTDQFCLNLLLHGFIKLEEVSFLVMDECENAVQNNPYRLIFRDFYQYNKQKKIKNPNIIGFIRKPFIPVTVADRKKLIQRLNMIKKNLHSKFVSEELVEMEESYSKSLFPLSLIMFDENENQIEGLHQRLAVQDNDNRYLLLTSKMMKSISKSCPFTNIVADAEKMKKKDFLDALQPMQMIIADFNDFNMLVPFLNKLTIDKVILFDISVDKNLLNVLFMYFGFKNIKIDVCIANQSQPDEDFHENMQNLVKAFSFQTLNGLLCIDGNHLLEIQSAIPACLDSEQLRSLRLMEVGAGEEELEILNAPTLRNKRTGALINYSNANFIVNNYFNDMNQQIKYTFQQVKQVNSSKPPLYQYSAIIKEFFISKFTGPLMKNKKQAQKALIFEIAKVLFEKGYIDDHLMPVQSIERKITANIKKDTGDPFRTKMYHHKRFNRKIPQVLTYTERWQPLNHIKNDMVFSIGVITTKCKRKEFLMNRNEYEESCSLIDRFPLYFEINLYDIGSITFGVALPLPMFPASIEFPLFLHSRIDVEMVPMNSVQISASDLEKVILFQAHFFRLFTKSGLSTTIYETRKQDKERVEDYYKSYNEFKTSVFDAEKLMYLILPMRKKGFALDNLNMEKTYSLYTRAKSWDRKKAVHMKDFFNEAEEEAAPEFEIYWDLINDVIEYKNWKSLQEYLPELEAFFRRKVMEEKAQVVGKTAAESDAIDADLISELNKIQIQANSSDIRYNGQLSSKSNEEEVNDFISFALDRLVLCSPYNFILYSVTEFRPDLNPTSCFGPFRTDQQNLKYKNYKEYFLYKHNLKVKNEKQPLIAARRLEQVTYYSRPGVAYTKTNYRSKKEHKLFVIPELITIHPISMAYNLVAALVPSVVFKLEYIFLIQEMLQKIQLPIKNSKYAIQALTSTRSQEPFHYERLETLGDCFLKFATTCDVFLSNPLSGEGELSNIRSKKINNMLLNEKALYLHLDEYILHHLIHSDQFCPPSLMSFYLQKNSFLKLPFSVHEAFFGNFQDEDESPMEREDKLKTSTHLPMKTLADVVEALIAASYIEHPCLAFYFLNSLDIISQNLFSYFNQKDLEYLELLFIKSGKQLNINENAKLDMLKERENIVENVDYDEIERKINYKFKNREILLCAITHRSLFEEENSSCYNYERLEFLGDAILDWIVVRQFYEKYPYLTPYELSNIRSSLVNNDMLGRLTVQYQLHSHIRYASHLNFTMSEYINMFERWHEENPNLKWHEMTIACPRMLGDIWESIAGAVLLDLGFNIAEFWKVYDPLMSDYMSNFGIENSNPIRKLAETIAKLHLTDYLEYKTITKDNKFYCEIYFNENVVGKGFGSNKLLAKKCAALNAWNYFETTQFGIYKSIQDKKEEKKETETTNTTAQQEKKEIRLNQDLIQTTNIPEVNLESTNTAADVPSKDPENLDLKVEPLPEKADLEDRICKMLDAETEKIARKSVN